LVHLEGHGREPVLEDVDVSRSIGWFTTRCPVWLPAVADPARALKQIKEKLRALPQRGLHWGLLRHLAPAPIQSRPRALPVPHISFNSLGQFQDAGGESRAFAFASEPSGSDVAPGSSMAHLLDLNGLIEGGRFSLGFRYSPGVFSDASVEELVGAFERELRSL